MKILEYECQDCNGTGLYSGMCEREGEAVICLGCNGTGKAIFEYRPFARRKGRRDIKTVSLSRGLFIVTGVGAKEGSSMSYKDFKSGRWVGK